MFHPNVDIGRGVPCSILHNVGLRMFNANLHPNWVYRFTRFYRAEMKARKFCYAFTDKIIHEKQLEFAKLKQRAAESNNNPGELMQEEEDDMLSYKKPQIFIDQLLTIPLPDGTPFSHDEIQDHIYTMIAAVSLLVGFHRKFDFCNIEYNLPDVISVKNIFVYLKEKIFAISNNSFSRPFIKNVW